MFHTDSHTYTSVYSRRYYSIYELDFTPTQGVNEFEVFVAGRRLPKNAISSYSADTKDSAGNFVTRFIAQDSAEGDVTLS